MKFGIVSLYQIAKHPFQSLLPADYLGDPDYIKKLLADPSKSNMIRLQYMVDQNIVTAEQMAGYVKEMQDAILKQPMMLVERYNQTLRDLLDSPKLEQ